MSASSIDSQHGPVTEIALLRLKQPLSTDSTGPSLPSSMLEQLAYGAAQQQSYSKFPVYLYQCIEDPQLIYLIGGWDSVSVHMNDWIPSPMNQELMQRMGDDIAVEYMFHLAINPEEVGSVMATEGTSKGDEEVVAFGHHSIRSGSRHQFQKTFDTNRHVLDDFIGGSQKVAGGWRVDVGFDPVAAASASDSGSSTPPDDFVLFTAWPTVEQHGKFAETKGFAEQYSKIREFVEKFEVRHGRKLNAS